MITRLSFPALLGLVALVVALLFKVVPANAAQYADFVIDARTGKVLHSTNADTRIHPASLTKMMTLYITFQAVQNGEISMDDMVTISRHAAAEPPSHLGLRPGQKIKLRYLVRAAAVKSANDAATAIGEYIAGSEAAFARRMNRTAKALGMTRTTFRNANGLTRHGHLSTARDLTTLGRHLFFDFPQYYNLFSRVSANAGIATVHNTNRRFLRNYEGADGIKTGYTNASGFNLCASARRGQERIIVTVIGGRSSRARNAQVAKLMDLGFRRAPSHAKIDPPTPAPYAPGGTVMAAKTAPVRPALRPEPEAPVLSADLTDTIDAAVSAAQEPDTITPTIPVLAALHVDGTDTSLRPRLRPGEQLAMADQPAGAGDAPAGNGNDVVVTRMSTSGEHYWGVSIGRFNTRTSAEKALIRTALAEIGTLDEALRKVVPRGSGYEANFMGLTQDGAELACRRLEARDMSCATIGPS